MPLTADELFERLAALGIETTTHRHPPLRTVEESKALRGELPGGHIKNLFLRDKKRRIWLVTVLEDRAVDLKALRRRLGAQGTLSFGSAELLMEVLGVEPGAVTPFGLVNDTGHRASFALDQAVLAHHPVNCHPLVNHMTTAIGPHDLCRFAEACGHAVHIIDFDAPEAEAEAEPGADLPGPAKTAM